MTFRHVTVVPTATVNEVGLKVYLPVPSVVTETSIVEPVVAVGLGALVAVGGAVVGVGLLAVPLVLPHAVSRKSIARASVENQPSVLGFVIRIEWVFFCIVLLLFPRLCLTPQQGVPGDAVPWPEREVSSLPSLFSHLPPQAAQERYLSSYLS